MEAVKEAGKNENNYSFTYGHQVIKYLMSGTIRHNVIDLSTTTPLFSKEGVGEIFRKPIKSP